MRSAIHIARSLILMVTSIVRPLSVFTIAARALKSVKVTFYLFLGHAPLDADLWSTILLQLVVLHGPLHGWVYKNGFF
jgi:hypothetical protein